MEALGRLLGSLTAELKNICRTVQVLPECLRLSKVPVVHCHMEKTMG